MRQIENEFLLVRARENGAELTSVFDKKTKIEHLWQADSAFWAWHAPVLFPVIGRCLNDEISIDGRAYKMEKHGFARKSNFKLLDLEETKMVFSLTWSDDTLKIYPYRFEFLVGYRLKGNELICSFEVINKDTKTIFFQLGGHPAFAVPFKPNEKYEDYYLEFGSHENSSRHLINEAGYFNGQTVPMLDNSNRISLLPDLFRDDAIIFKDLKSTEVSIRSKNHSEYLSVAYAGFNYLGIWAKVNASYVCIEPWLGCADSADKPLAFSAREGVIRLEPEQEYSAAFRIKAG